MLVHQVCLEPTPTSRKETKETRSLFSPPPLFKTPVGELGSLTGPGVAAPPGSQPLVEFEISGDPSQIINWRAGSRAGCLVPRDRTQHDTPAGPSFCTGTNLRYTTVPVPNPSMAPRGFRMEVLRFARPSEHEARRPVVDLHISGLI